MHWCMLASAEEVYNELNSLAMEIEPFYYVSEAEYGDAVRQYKFDENTFFKAEQLWSEREGLA